MRAKKTMNGQKEDRKRGDYFRHIDEHEGVKDANDEAMTQVKSYRSGHSEIRTTPRAIKVSPQAAASWSSSGSSRDATAAFGSGFLPKHHLHHRRYELMASVQVHSESRALQMPYCLS